MKLTATRCKISTLQLSEKMNVEIDGLNVFYEVGGSGASVVLLHGWGGNSESFKPVFDYLINNYKTYTLDLPGFGNSDLPPCPWGADDYARLILGFFEKLQIDKANIIAHSFGGRIAIVLAAEQPEKVEKLVLVGSAGIIPRRTVKYHVRVSIAKMGKLLFAPQLFGTFGVRGRNAISRLVGSKDYQDAGELRGTFVKVVNEDLKPRLPKIRASTLLVWGEKDTATPISHAKIMEKEIEDAGLVVLQNAGHFSYLDNFPQFCRIVSRFLGK